MKFKKLKLNQRNDRELFPEDLLLDKLAQKYEEELGIQPRKIEIPLSRNSLFYFYLSFLILIFILAGKTFWLQTVEHQKYLLLAKANQEKIRLIRPLRGIIYDSNFEPLVENLPSFDLLLDKKNLPKRQEERNKVLERVGEILGKERKELEEKITKSQFSEVLIFENIPQEKLILLEAEIKKLPGFFIEKNIVRNYLKGPEFSHLLGFTGRITQQEFQVLQGYSISDYIGKEGLEKFYEKVLRGKPGKIIIEKDALGKKIGEAEISKPENGKNLALWIDSRLEKVLARALNSGLKKVGSKRGAAIALDPQKGAVLALVSLPNYDNNLFSQGISPEDFQKIIQNPDQPLFNRAIAGQYPTGSTIKPLIAAIALQEHLISAKKKIHCQGEIQVPHQYHPEIIYTFKDWKIHGWTDLREAIAESCNVYFYMLGGGYKEQKGLGVKRIKKYLQFFGWGRKTGIDLPGEAEGFLPDPAWKKKTLGEAWYIGNTYHLSIGQGYLRITPLQVALATAAIANGGKLLQPQLVKTILDSEKNIIGKKPKKIIRENFIDPENLKIVKEGMREAVIYGSSRILNDLPVKVASKTGTAQTPREGYYHHWVTLFAPYENPEIVLTIIIEDVKGLKSATLPVAKEVLSWYFSKSSFEKK